MNSTSLKVFLSNSVLIGSILLGTVQTTANAQTGNQAPTIAPISTVTVNVDEEVRVRIQPFDSDGDVPGLNLLSGPSGSTLEDNGDGTRSFVWTPRRNEVGEFTITVRAIDAVAVSYTHLTLPTIYSV